MTETMKILWIPVMTMILMSNMNKNTNPMKICWTMIFTVSSMSFMIWKETSMNSSLMIILMVFLGGLMILYMIMTSVLPNKKLKKKSKYPKILFMILIPTILMSETKVSNTKILETKELKNNMESFQNIMFILLFMSIYSFIVTKMSMKEEGSLRTME